MWRIAARALRRSDGRETPGRLWLYPSASARAVRVPSMPHAHLPHPHQMIPPSCTIFARLCSSIRRVVDAPMGHGQAGWPRPRLSSPASARGRRPSRGRYRMMCALSLSVTGVTNPTFRSIVCRICGTYQILLFYVNFLDSCRQPILPALQYFGETTACRRP